MMQGYALGTTPHSAAAWHTAHLTLTVTWSSARIIPAVGGYTSSSPPLKGASPSVCGVLA